MLQRLFSRGVSRDRIIDAVEHGGESEQRDALRERSATILQRLEKRRSEARNAELERRRAEADAADLAEQQAADNSFEETPLQPMPAVDESTSAVADRSAEMPVHVPDAEEDHEPLTDPAGAGDETGMADHEPAFREVEAASEEGFDGLAEAPAGDGHDVAPHASMEAFQSAPDFESRLDPEPADEAADHGAEDMEQEAVEFRPIEEPDPVADPAEFDLPEEPVEAHSDMAPADFGEAEEAETYDDEDVSAVAEADSAAPEPRQSHDLFSDSEPLRSSVTFEQLPSDPEEDTAFVHGAERVQAHESVLAKEDPEAYERLLRKAEEAKARIAKRLETLKAEEEASKAASLLDIGAAAPPLAPDHGDEDL